MKKVVWDLKSEFSSTQNSEVFDCMVAEFLLADGVNLPKEKVMTKYKVDNLDDLAKKQLEKFEKLPKLYKLFTEIEMPFVKVLWQMEQNGIELDKEELASVGRELDSAITKAEAELIELAGRPLNWNSPAQVGAFLAEEQNIPLLKTKTGKYATNENELSKYERKFPVVGMLFKFRELKKLRSTYIENLIDRVAEDGRVHTTYSQVAAATGRLSSNNPNLQNIPVTSEYGQKIKACFRAAEGKVLVSFDYSQQELRILAHLTGEEGLVNAFAENLDVHKATAASLFGVEYDNVTKMERNIAKTINFGIIYGMGSFGMSNQLQIPVEDAQKFINRFYEKYPKIKSYFTDYLEAAKKQGFAETILGRRRSIYEYPGQKFISNSMRRVLMNYPIQGSAADLMRMAMVRVQTEIVEKNPDCKLLLQIHDDLVFEMDDEKEKIEKIGKDIKEIMCNIYPLSVPVEVEMKIGKKWGQWD